jgi:hypothetical protein
MKCSTKFASTEPFLVFHVMIIALSPEIIILHDPGMCVPFHDCSPFKVSENAKMILQVGLIFRKL